MEQNKSKFTINKNEKYYNVYIDESGDEGIDRGSKYFIITAVIVDNINDSIIQKKIYEIKEMLEIKKSQLHWNQIKGFPNKKFIIDEIITENFTIIHLIVDTTSITYLKSKEIYFKYLNYLLERISIYINKSKIKNFNISSRKGLSYKAIIEGLSQECQNIILNQIGRIKILPNKSLQLLQLDDICASSFHQSLKYNTNNTKYYTLQLQKHFFRKNNKLVGYGIKLVPKNGTFKEYYDLNI